MYASDYFERNFLNIMNEVTFAAPEDVFVALFITNPTDEAKGIEVKYEGYERQKVAFTVPALEEGNIRIRNAENISFPKSDTDAGTATYIAYYDSKTAGNMLAYSKLTEDLEIRAGEAPILVKNEISIFCTGQLSRAYQKKLLNLLRGYSIEGVKPFIALFNGNAEEGGSELLADNYQRVEVLFDTPSDNISGQTVISNNTELMFNRPTTDWGNWSYTVLMDDESHGEPIFIYDRGGIKELKKGHMPRVAKGDLKFAIN